MDIKRHNGIKNWKNALILSIVDWFCLSYGDFSFSRRPLSDSVYSSSSDNSLIFPKLNRPARALCMFPLEKRIQGQDIFYLKIIQLHIY